MNLKQSMGTLRNDGKRRETTKTHSGYLYLGLWPVPAWFPLASYRFQSVPLVSGRYKKFTFSMSIDLVLYGGFESIAGNDTDPRKAMTHDQKPWKTTENDFKVTPTKILCFRSGTNTKSSLYPCFLRVSSEICSCCLLVDVHSRRTRRNTFRHLVEWNLCSSNADSTFIFLLKLEQ